MNAVSKELRRVARPEKVKILSRFFKTGKGEYGEGDQFIGVVVPDARLVSQKFISLSLNEIEQVLSSNIHEERLVGLLILVEKYKQAQNKKEIVDFYLAHTSAVNNWDLVDLTADKILGTYLLDKNRSVLYRLAKSKNLWERRIAIIATFEFIRHHQFEDTFAITELLMNDHHDLIHKALGWMLREAGKRDQLEEEKFLKKHYQKMPRTTLRYAIERFDDEKRRFYLNKP